jgi:hypothetical protein
MPLGGSANQLSQPLGRGVPLPGGDIIDTPQQRATKPGGAPGGLGNMPPPAQPRTAGGVGDMPSFEDTRTTLMEQHQRNKALFSQTGQALKKIDVIRKGLERLADKQDVVTMDDIIDEAGKLVAHGIDPMALAGILADAPQEGGGEALGGWVASHAQAAAQGEQAMMQQHTLARHNMGVSAIHLIMAHTNAQMMNGGVSPPMGEPGGNDLNGNQPSQQIPMPTPGDTDNTPNGNPLAVGSRFMGDK